MRRSSAAVASLLLLAYGRADAQARPDEELQPAFLQIRVNSVPGETSLVHLEGGDAWVSVHDMEQAALSGFGGTRREIAGREAVSLLSLGPHLSFEIDDRALVLRITTGPALLGRRQLTIGRGLRPPGMETATAPSAFLNYAIRSTTQKDVSGVFESGVSAGNALLSSSLSATKAYGWVRGLTALSIDEPRELVRFVAGDALVPSDGLGGTPVVGGITLGRELSLDPYLVRAPLPGASAFAATPSVLEVWVNGALARTQELAPGTYDLSQLPVSSGANDVRIVVKDAFGRTQSLEAAHYQAQGLLARGLDDWGLHVGAVRRSFGIESFDYGDPLLLLRHRTGLTHRVTTGFRMELTPHVRQVAASATAALPVGELEVGAAASDDNGDPEATGDSCTPSKTVDDVPPLDPTVPKPPACLPRGDLGGAGLLAFRFGTRRASAGADLTLRSRRYATSTLRAEADRPLWRAGAFASVPVHRTIALTLQATASFSRDASAITRRLEARTSIPLAPRLWLSLTAAASRTGAADTEGSVFVQLIAAPAVRDTYDAGVRVEEGVVAGSAGAQRTLPHEGGVGWRVRGDTTADGSLSALLQVQPPFGRYEASYERAFGAEVGTLTAAGGLVLVENRLFATRPVDQSFALVQVPGVGGVRVRLENQIAGRTDGSGHLLVPGLLPYYGNRLSIADVDVPATYRVGRVERVVAAPRRGAALVRFDVEPLRAVSGSLRLAGARGTRVPAYGTLEADTPRGTRGSPVAEDGGFWLEDVPSGTHSARVYFEGEACEFSLSVPESGPGVFSAGTLVCEER